MIFKKGDIVWIKKGDRFIKGYIVKPVMPYHGMSFKKGENRYYVSDESDDFSKPYSDTDLQSWLREKQLIELGL